MLGISLNSKSLALMMTDDGPVVVDGQPSLIDDPRKEVLNVNVDAGHARLTAPNAPAHQAGQHIGAALFIFAVRSALTDEWTAGVAFNQTNSISFIPCIE